MNTDEPIMKTISICVDCAFAKPPGACAKALRRRRTKQGLCSSVVQFTPPTVTADDGSGGTKAFMKLNAG